MILNKLCEFARVIGKNTLCLEVIISKDDYHLKNCKISEKQRFLQVESIPVELP